MEQLKLWRFIADPTDAGLHLGYAAPGYPDGLWREVSVPVDFETCHPALSTYEGVGWFRHALDVHQTWRGQRVTLHIGGVNTRARVWVNGEDAGSCEAPWLPYAFDIQDSLRMDRRNVIAVRVDNRMCTGSAPGTHWGWRNFGGILREVALDVGDLCEVDVSLVAAQPVGRGGRLAIDVLVTNARAAVVEGELSASVHTPDGRLVTTLPGRDVRIEAATSARVAASQAMALTGVVADIVPWSPDTPQLYDVLVTLKAGDTEIAARPVRTGFRRVEVRAGQLLLNGAPIFLTGFNRHEDSPVTNQCPDLSLVRSDLMAIKEAGANFVRLCHYPHHPGEVALCDEIGLLVMDEIPLYWWEGDAAADAVAEPGAASALEDAARQLRRLIRRDRHHPSVLFWSVSNETKEGHSDVAVGNRALIRLVRELDPTRLVVHVSDHWRQHPNFDEDDVVCVNAYPSFDALQSSPTATPDLDASERFWREGLAALHACHPKKPILVTEFGSVSLEGTAEGPYSEALQSEILAREFAAMDATYVCGATVWCWANHAWPPAHFEYCSKLAVSPYGVVTRNRRRKAAYWTVRRLFYERQGRGRSDRGADAVAGASPTRGSERGSSGRPVWMVRRDLSDIPLVSPPEGFLIRTMRRDEGGLWTDIWRDADPFGRMGPDVFASQFGGDLPALERRGFVVENPDGAAVATITAWYNRDYHGEDYGQIHWVATRRAYWGRGIGKAMMSHALVKMAQWHDKACLATQTERLPAIKLYLDFGFVPDLEHPGAVAAWREVTAALDHPVLAALSL